MFWLAHVIGWNVGVFSRVGFRLGTPPRVLVTSPITPATMDMTLDDTDQARAAALDPSAANVFAGVHHAIYGDMPATPLGNPPTLPVGQGLGLGDLPWYAYNLGS